MHKNRHLYRIGIIVFLFSSCCYSVDKEMPDFDPVPTLNCIIADGKPIEAHISQASLLNTMQIQGFKNATVALFEDNIFIGHMQGSHYGWFGSQHLAFITPITEKTRCTIIITPPLQVKSLIPKAAAPNTNPLHCTSFHFSR